MTVLLPGSTIGIIGGGQLGRMLSMVARRMGYRTVVLDPDPHAPAAQVADEHIVAGLSEIDAALDLARRSDVVTLEWENADVAAVRALAAHVPVRPGPDILEIAQNRIREKETARSLGLETADFVPVRSLADLRYAVRQLGLPLILKTASGGYDGRGQEVITSSEDVDTAYERLGGATVEMIAEARIEFQLEASVICARSEDGAVAVFPIGENRHREGILDFTIVPAPIGEPVRRAAVEAGLRLIEGMNMVGLLAVELFITPDGHVLVNEIAPRPHNSGHYSWEACSVSQFEQQLRAVCGLPLHQPELLRPAAMANLLGEHIGTGMGLAPVSRALGVPMLSLHLYGKRETSPRRKMGHLTALADDPETAFERVSRGRALLTDTLTQDG